MNDESVGVKPCHHFFSTGGPLWKKRRSRNAIDGVPFHRCFRSVFVLFAERFQRMTERDTHRNGGPERLAGLIDPLSLFAWIPDMYPPPSVNGTRDGTKSAQNSNQPP